MSAFGNLETPGEQAFADQVVAATRELAHLSTRGHMAVHHGDLAEVERVIREQFAIVAQMDRTLALNVIVGLANLAAGLAHGEDCTPIDPEVNKIWALRP